MNQFENDFFGITPHESKCAKKDADLLDQIGRFSNIVSTDDMDNMELTDDESEEMANEVDEDGNPVVENDDPKANALDPEKFGIKPTVQQGKGRKKNIYCNNAELVEEIRKYQQEGNATEKLGELIIKIAIHMTTMPRFFRYPHSIKEELVEHAILQMLISVPKFDLNNKKFNAFGYMSMISYRDMLHSLKRHYKQNKVRAKIAQGFLNKLSDNGADERIGMLRQTLERNEEYNNFLRDEKMSGEKIVDTFALSKDEQERRYKESLKTGENPFVKKVPKKHKAK